jgi:hypothetical protein
MRHRWPRCCLRRHFPDILWQGAACDHEVARSSARTGRDPAADRHCVRIGVDDVVSSVQPPITVGEVSYFFPAFPLIAVSVDAVGGVCPLCFLF